MAQGCDLSDVALGEDLWLWQMLLRAARDFLELMCLRAAHGMGPVL